MAKKILSVAAIKDGSVIDHITAKQGLRIVRILELAKAGRTVTIGLNLPSKTHGKKDIVKVEGLALSSEETDRIAVLAPYASINTITDYEITNKHNVAVPSILHGVVICPNPTCVTNHETAARSYHTATEGSKVSLTCRFCERTFSLDDVDEYEM